MRGRIAILLAAAAVVTGPAYAKEHGHHQGNGHANHHSNSRHDENHRWSGNHDRHHAEGRHHRHNYVVYVAPHRGWHYRRLHVGYNLEPAFYAPRYYVTDYGIYHVRAPGRWKRWVRYGDDLLLVNIRTGRVLEVIPGAFY